MNTNEEKQYSRNTIIKENPFVSIIVPTFNRAYCIERSIKSVLNQTYRNFELLIIDDGSSDNTEEVVNSIVDERIKYFKTKKNKGVGAARNYGVAMAKGNIIAFQDSDDEWFENKLELEICKMIKDDCGLVFGRFYYVNQENGLIPADTNEEILNMMDGEHGMADQLLMGNKIGAPLMLIQKDLFLSCGGFDETMKSQEDWDLAIRLTASAKVGFVDKALMIANSDAGGINSITGRVEAFVQILTKYHAKFSDKNLFKYLLTLIISESASQSIFLQKYYFGLLISKLKKRSNNPILSIIVPVCNVEKYLVECIDSILRQPMEDFEIICINDGSTDRSLAILNDYARIDSRVHVISKENTGYGDSMNIGIKAAKGQYIGFVESDDSVCDAAFPILCAMALVYNADIAKGNYNYYYSQTNKIELYSNLRNFPEFKLLNVLNDSGLFYCAPSLWSGIYKKELLQKNQISFLPTPGASYQDTSFAFKTWACAKRVVITQKPIINYRVDNADSSSNETKKVFNICSEFSELENFLKLKRLKKYYPHLMRVRYISYGWNANRLALPQKICFWLSTHHEFWDANARGYFKEELWDEASLFAMKKILFDLQNMCTPWIEEIKDNYKLVKEMLQEAPIIYIYGDAVHRKQVQQGLKAMGLSATAFLELNEEKNGNNEEEIPLLRLEDSDKRGLILCNVSINCKEEMIESFHQRGFYNFIDVPDILLKYTDMKYDADSVIKVLALIDSEVTPDILESVHSKIRDGFIMTGLINDFSSDMREKLAQMYYGGCMAKTNKTVSIVVTANGSKRHLNECLDSLLTQTYSKLEVIYIDDGLDESGSDIINGYMENDKRIKKYDRDDEYVLKAENVGLHNAKGSYVMFIDAEDRLMPNAVKELVMLAEDNQLEVLSFDAISNQNDESSKETNKISGVKSGLDLLVDLEENASKCNSVNLLFLNRKWVMDDCVDKENNLLGLQVLCKASRAIHVSNPYYIVRDNKNSMLTSAKEVYDKLDDYTKFRKLIPTSTMELRHQNAVMTCGKSIYDSIAQSIGSLSGKELIKLGQMNLDNDMSVELFNMGFNLYGVRAASYLISKCNEMRKIEIYGAGKWGRMLLCFLLAQGIEKSKMSFVVSKRGLNASELMGVPCYSLDEKYQMDKNEMVIVAFKNNEAINLVSELKEQGFTDVLQLNPYSMRVISRSVTEWYEEVEKMIR